MYCFYNTESANEAESFANLKEAIKGHDDIIILKLLRDNPQLVNHKTNKGTTVPMLVAKHGCSEEVFKTILEKAPAEILELENENGDTLISILEEHHRDLLLDLYREKVPTLTHQ